MHEHWTWERKGSIVKKYQIEYKHLFIKNCFSACREAIRKLLILPFFFFQDPTIKTVFRQCN
jgi:hypothetical protein